MANVSGAVAPQAKAGSVKDVTTASFRADVLAASTRQPVLVDFWAPWCGPCKQLAPVLEKAVADSGGKVTLVKMNIDEHPQIAGQLGIQSIPAVFAFDKGQPVDGFVGALPESQIRGFIERLVGPLCRADRRRCWPRPRKPPPKATRPGRRRSMPRSSPTIRATPKRSAASPSSMSPPATRAEAKALLEMAPPRRRRQRARPGDRRAPAALAPRRAGLDRRRTRAARTGHRRQSQRSPGALRPRGRALGQGRPGRRGRPAA